MIQAIIASIGVIMITEAFSHDNDTLKWIDYNDLYCARKIEKFIA